VLAATGEGWKRCEDIGDADNMHGVQYGRCLVLQDGTLMLAWLLENLSGGIGGLRGGVDSFERG